MKQNTAINATTMDRHSETYLAGSTVVMKASIGTVSYHQRNKYLKILINMLWNRWRTGIRSNNLHVVVEYHTLAQFTAAQISRNIHNIAIFTPSEFG